MKKKGLFSVLTFIGILVLIVGMGFFGWYMKNSFQKTQGYIKYLQDSISILQTDLTNMKDELRKTMEDENSLLEEHHFELKTINFANNSYTLDITVIPKDITSKTKVSVFFGVEQYELVSENFMYKGTVELPFEDSYTGNVTIVIEEGDSRKTEVLHDYDGYVNEFSSILSASSLELPVLQEEDSYLVGPQRIELQCKKDFQFRSCKLWVCLDGEKLCKRDYMDDEEQTQDVIFMDGAKLSFVPEAQKELLVYVEAITEDGYTFVYQLFEGIINETCDGFVEDSISQEGIAIMIDRYGNERVLKER